jgi:hypothetical protein
VTIEGKKLKATDDFPAAEFEGSACKGNWQLRETSSGNVAVEGTLSLVKK